MVMMSLATSMELSNTNKQQQHHFASWFTDAAKRCAPSGLAHCAGAAGFGVLKSSTRAHRALRTAVHRLIVSGQARCARRLAYDQRNAPPPHIGL